MNQGDFRRHAEANGKPAHAEAGRDDHIPPIFANMAICVAGPVTRGYTERPVEWKCYLAAMRMATNRKGYAIWHIRKYVRLMRQHDHGRLICDLRHASGKIIEPSEAVMHGNRPLIS